MTSRGSFCNSTLLRKNITRFWPVWAILTLILLMTYPLITSIESRNEPLILVETVNETTFTFGICIAAAYAIVCAACNFSYLHKTRSAYMLHAFPVTRSTLFLTNTLSGFLFFLVPWTAVAGLNMLMILPWGATALKAMLLCWLVLLLIYLCFYGIAIFCMFLTGKTISGVLIYCVLNFIVTAMEGLLQVVIEPALYGINSFEILYMKPLSPFLYLLGGKVLNSTYIGPEYYNKVYHIDWMYLGIIAAVGIALLGAAWLLYRRRHMESAGKVITVKWARPIYQITISLVGALTIGLIIAELLTGGWFNGAQLLLVFCLSIGGFVGYFLAEMRLKKSVKVFRGRAFLGFGCFALVFSLLILAFYYDWFGIVRKVPDSSEIVSVEISYQLQTAYRTGYITLDTPDEINELRELHLGIAENVDHYNGGYHYDCLKITYRLTDNRTLTRCYPITDIEESKSKDNLQRAKALLERPENATEYLLSLMLSEAKEVEVFSASSGNSYIGNIVNQNQITALCDAIYTDVAEGNLSIFFLPTDGHSDLLFTFKNGKAYHLLIPTEASTILTYLNTLLITEETK